MRVAIVNDLALAREVLRRVIASAPGHTVAWTAADGAEAVARAAQDRPDVILMDLVMPVMDGVEATRRIMAESPCPILLVTSSVTENYTRVFEAMGHGGLDAVNTPVLAAGGAVRGGDAVLARLARLAAAKQAPSRAAALAPAAPAAKPAGAGPPLVLLGASTGGPEALACVLAGLPAGFPAAVVIAQHIAADFVPGLADWLQGRTPLRVRLVREGDEASPGAVHLAMSADHLVLRPDRRLGYTVEPAENPFRPSVDVLFASAAAHWPQPGVAVVLTGMGNDGGRGLLALRQGGWFTVAQDQATSVVYGMPRHAAELHAPRQVLPLAEVGPAILDWVNRTHATSGGNRGP
jgi:two-component system response regulator WspF